MIYMAVLGIRAHPCRFSIWPVRWSKLNMVQEITPVIGYLSQGDPRAHFGLGTAPRAELVEIRWPDGQTTQLRKVKANQILEVVQDIRQGAQAK